MTCDSRQARVPGVSTFKQPASLSPLFHSALRQVETTTTQVDLSSLPGILTAHIEIRYIEGEGDAAVTLGKHKKDLPRGLIFGLIISHVEPNRA